jgi:hypothetical protein
MILLWREIEFLAHWRATWIRTKREEKETETASPPFGNNDRHSNSDTPVVSVSPTTAPTRRSTSLQLTSIDSEETETFSPSPADNCRQAPWLENCTEWYNTGNWTVLPSPMEWNQNYSIEDRVWNMTRFTSASECQRVGTSLEWRSHTHDSGWDAHRFLQALGPNKRICRRFSHATALRHLPRGPR